MASDSDPEDDRESGLGSDAEVSYVASDPGSDDGDEYYDNDDADPVASYDERVNAAKRDIKTKKKFASEDEVEDFLHRYRDIAPEFVDKADGNLLHALIDVVKHNADDVKSGDIERLVRRIVEKWPSRVKDVNKHGFNPVFMAINNTQYELASYMISACKDRDRECLDSALGAKDQAGMTCLHVAFKDNIDPGTTRMLVETASDAVLSLQDKDGNTPMHYAVVAEQCYGPRVELISLLIDRDLRALKNNSARSPRTFLDLFAWKAGKSVSVYMEQEASIALLAKKYANRKAKKETAGASSSKQQQGDALLRSSARTERPKESTREKPRQGPSAEPNGDRGTNKPGNHGGAGDGVVDREEVRRQKKAEEAKKKAEETKTRVAEGTGRPEDRKKTSNGDGHLDANMGIRRSLTMRGNLDPEQERAREERAREERAKEERAREEKAKEEKAKRKGSSKSSSKSSSGLIKSMVERLENSDAMLLKLKLHYMRTRSAEMVISFLYGTNINDVQISFDYDKLPREMLWKEFLNHFGADKGSDSLRFDRVLQYVTFPSVEVIVKGPEADRRRKAELKDPSLRQFGPLGRKDMQYFFDWLYQKGVRHIIRVSVEDSGDSGEKVHSDQAIQKSLERFIVEHLDWRKTDLDPETILRVSSKVEREPPSWKTKKPEEPKIEAVQQLKKLYLRWSGSNAVLRGWSEPEGLAMLPYLRQIHLFPPPADKTYDSEAWIGTRIRDFQARLHASQQAARARARKHSQGEHTSPGIPGVGNTGGEFYPVEVLLANRADEGGGEAASHQTSHLASASVKGVNSHRWLEATGRFAGVMTAFWDKTAKDFIASNQNRPTADGLESDVVVALIDDGVDRFNTPLEANRVLDGKSFDFHDGTVRPPYSSANGHGTVMASMILRVCPMAKIYPIRLKTFNDPEGKNLRIDAGYAAQAIQAALDKKATIISMSWTVPMKEAKADKKKKQRLHDVLEEAVKRGVLMFCSTPDKGNYIEQDYPSGPWPGSFFRIGAAGADGNPFGWTGTEGVTYLLPGVDVIKAYVKSNPFEASSTQDIQKRMDGYTETGSSVSTALAAGLAAMIIYCVKASVLTVQTENAKQGSGSLLGTLPLNAAESIAHFDEMKRAFASLGTPTKNNFVQVWEELDKISEVLETWHTPTSTAEAKKKAVGAFVDFGLKLWSAAHNKH